jgi:Rab-GTPase-TBC domain
MEHYDLRSCFLPDMSGLHLRIFQFQQLLAEHLPSLSAHLNDLQVEPGYVSQWFLSFFAVTCPLPMLLRIYDVIFAEGAPETMMRVALSLMRRNEKKLLACEEYDEVIQMLLSRSLWDPYQCNADILVNDFCGLTGVVTREGLIALEKQFTDSAKGGLASKPEAALGLQIQATASRFLGRLWAASSPTNTASQNSTASLAAPLRPASTLRRTPSKQSLASTLSSFEGGSDSRTSTASTAATEVMALSKQELAERGSVKSSSSSTASIVAKAKRGTVNKDKDLHSQIEDLLTALSSLQREQALVSNQLEKEREERDEDKQLIRILLVKIKKSNALEILAEVEELAEQSSSDVSTDDSDLDDQDDKTIRESVGESGLAELATSLKKAEERFGGQHSRRSSNMETKQQLRQDLSRARELFSQEQMKAADLERQSSEKDLEISRLRDSVKQARMRVTEGQKEKQRMEKTIQDLRSSTMTMSARASTDILPPSPTESETRLSSTTTPGLREFKLGRAGSQRSQTAPAELSSKESALSPARPIAADGVAIVDDAGNEALLQELVAAKTAEAVARQDAEETRAKLESLRRLLGAKGGDGPGLGGHRPSPSQPIVSRPSLTTFNSYAGPGPASNSEVAARVAATPTVSQDIAQGIGASLGRWTGWGKRSVTNPTPAEWR